MSLSADKALNQRAGVEIALPVAADAVIWLGALVAVNATGYALPATATGGLTVVGVAQTRVDNTGGSAGDLSVVVRRGQEWLLKGSSLAQSAVGDPVYVVDDETVAPSVAGTAVEAESLVADAGGTAKTFTGMLAHGAVVPGSVTIAATVGAAAKAMTDDGQGRLAGTGVGSGFIDYGSGFYHLVFSTAPDDDTAVTADYAHGAVAIPAGTLTEYVSATAGWVAVG